MALILMQLLQPHQQDLSQSPDGSFLYSKQHEQLLALQRYDHWLSHLYAFIAKLSILVSFFQIILTLAAIFLG